MKKTVATHPFNLDEVRVAAPCNAGWENMKGDDRARFCGLCKKNVYNLSDMSRAEASALIREKDGNLCVRYYRRPDGTILTDNCPVGLRAIRNRVRWASVAAVAAFVAIGAFAGLRSAKAAGVSIREIQPFKTLQNAQPVKALVDWLDPILMPAAIGNFVEGRMKAPTPAAPVQTPPNPDTKS